jgi:hypothetical protein
VIFGWKKTTSKPGSRSSPAAPKSNPRPAADGPQVRFQQVSLPPAIQDLSLEIHPGAWVMLYGDDDFAKALFCDLCFSYISPEAGSVAPCLRGSDVSFLGRSNTTYGRTLLDHLSCGVNEKSRAQVEFAVKQVLSPRFRRHLSEDSLEFKSHRAAHEVELDERDFLEIAEANLLLQRRKAAVIDTTSDFYQIAMEQGFRHSSAFLNSGKTLVWLLHDSQPLPEDARYWNMRAYQDIRKLSLSFPAGANAGYVN